MTTVVPGEMRTGSYRHAFFSGDREGEFRWFSLGAALSTTISADRAAGHIIRAVKRGQAELILSVDLQPGHSHPWRCTGCHFEPPRCR